MIIQGSRSKRLESTFTPFLLPLHLREGCPWFWRHWHTRRGPRRQKCSDAGVRGDRSEAMEPCA